MPSHQQISELRRFTELSSSHHVARHQDEWVCYNATLNSYVNTCNLNMVGDGGLEKFTTLVKHTRSGMVQTYQES